MKKSVRKPIMIISLVILCAVFCISGTVTVVQTVMKTRENQAFSDLKGRLEERPKEEQSEKESDGDEDSEGTEYIVPESIFGSAGEESLNSRSTNGRYDELYAENPDLFGWITIEGTKIDYPVMYTPNDPEYYLHRSFEKKYSSSGVPFMDSDCYEGCGNYLLYGHHMRNGTMFAALTQYRKEEFWQEHKTIIFDTVEDHGVYEVIAVLHTRIYKTTDTGVFRWYNYTDLTDEEVFNEYIAGLNDEKLYDTGVTAEFGDQLITLSTCGKDSVDRYVVAAKRVN